MQKRTRDGAEQQSRARAGSRGLAQSLWLGFLISLVIFVGALLMLALCTLNGELTAGHDFLLSSEHGQQAAYEIVAFAILLFAGLKIVLTIVKHYSAVMAVTTTSVRRALTLCLSFILFPKPFTLTHGNVAVLFGILSGLCIYASMKLGEKEKASAGTPNLV